jgi:arylsulfatase A-like enzyme/HEAT repeat protein
VGVSAFRGHWAASLPGHHALSALLAAAGTLFVAGVAAWAPKARAALAARGERSRWSVTLLCFALALASGAISRQVLPRLYGWFHLCLVLVAFGALFAAVTAWPRKWSMADPSTSVRRRWRFVAAFLLLLAVGVTEARRSQTLRFALHEKTVVGKELLARLPLPLEPRTLAAVERQSAEDHLPPLPEGPRRPDADVLLITVDALRADHVGAYGYPRATTPNIDALARKSTRFDLAYTQAPHTSFSVASMLTGKYFPTLARLAPAEVHDPLAAVLRSYGWRTAAFYPPAVFYVDAKKLKPYQDTHFSFEYVKFEYLDADKRVDQIGRYFDEVKPARAFLWVHFFEPHEPYETHAAYDFGGGDVDRYDSEIAYTDAAIGRLLALVAQRRPETIVILAADHGEEFDEHGGRYHGSTLYEEQVRVPFLIYVPGVRGHVIPQPVELLDITPTILSLLDVPVPERVRGTDLGPWLADPPADPARLPPAFAEVEDKRMIVQGREKLICDLNWGFCAFYDLAHDPAEKHNLAESEPAKAAALRGRLDEWLDGHVRLEPRLGKGLSNPDGGPVPRAIERGRLGDLSVARDLADLMMAPNASVAVRREAAQLLTALPPRAELAAAIERGLSSDDMGVADWAAVAAARLGLMQAVPRAEAIVQRADAGRLLRVRAGLALANVGSAAGVPAMVEALDDRDDILQVRLIVLALGKLRDRRAVPALLEHVEEVLNRREMVDALGDIGDPRAVPSLITHLKSDAYVPVRAQAAFALAKIARGEEQRGSAPDAAKTAEDVRTALREVLRDEREVSVREAAVAALGSLTRPPGASAETKTRARRR